jgi:hypothetical protein
VLLPVILPEASRRVVTDEPFVVWLPVDRPDASRKSVRVALVPLARVVALPVKRPLASRNFVWDDPAEESFVVAVPVMRPEASRKVVRVEPPEPPWLVEVPMTRPEASRIVERVIVPLFWWSMVCVTRPDESRTTSRQVWAGEGTTRIHDVASRGRDILIRASTDDDPKSFEEKITFRKPSSSSASLPDRYLSSDFGHCT